MQKPQTEPKKDVDRLASIVIDASLAVHRSLGPGFLESIYEEALTLELTSREIPIERQKAIAVSYKGALVGESRLDLLVGGLLVVELKAIDAFAAIHQAQMLSYLRMTGLTVGLLINFNVSLLKNGIKRIVHTADPLAPWRLGGSIIGK
jgi:GxxExxY protein